MASGNTLWQELCQHYCEGVAQVKAFRDIWAGMRPYVSAGRYKEVLELLDRNVHDAELWRDTCLGYFSEVSGLTPTRTK